MAEEDESEVVQAIPSGEEAFNNILKVEMKTFDENFGDNGIFEQLDAQASFTERNWHGRLGKEAQARVEKLVGEHYDETERQLKLAKKFSEGVRDDDTRDGAAQLMLDTYLSRKLWLDEMKENHESQTVQDNYSGLVAEAKAGFLYVCSK